MSATPRPGVSCPPTSSNLDDFIRRSTNVKDGFLLGVSKYAYDETVNKLGEDLRLIIDSLWPGFVDALKIYGASIGAGAVIFGIAGAVFGGGVGAVPGAVAGASIGSAVASGIMVVLGLKFLIEYVIAHLDATSTHFKRAFEQSWADCGSPPNLELPAKEFARGIAELFSLMLQAAAAWIIKKGLKAGLESLNKSKTGQALVPYAKVQYWRNQLGLTDAKVPREGLAATIEFFENPKNKLGELKEADLKGYWKAMDFSKKVVGKVDGKDFVLEPGKELVAYRDPKSPFGYYYTEPGTFIDRIGIDYDMLKPLPKDVSGPPQLIPREFIRYRVKETAPALKSISSGVKAHDTLKPVPGGGTQYFIPDSWNKLEVINKKPQ